MAMNPKAKAKENPHKKARKSHHRKSNPHLQHHRRSHRRSANPRGFALVDALKAGGGAAIGALGTRSITQMVLGKKNQGPIGYLGNLAVAILLGYGTAYISPGALALGVTAGGVSATLLRVWSEQISRTSPAELSGLGDLDFSTNGLGAYVHTGFAIPSVSKAQGGLQIVQAPPYGAPALLPTATSAPAPTPVSPATAAKAAQGKHLAGSGRFASRF